MQEPGSEKETDKNPQTKQEEKSTDEPARKRGKKEVLNETQMQTISEMKRRK